MDEYTVHSPLSPGMRSLLRLLLRLLFRTLFHFRVDGLESLNTAGPLLLIPNHVSWLDWLMVAVCLPEHWRFVVSGATAQTSWVHRKIMVNQRTFLIDSSAPHSARKIAEHLRRGGCLVLFAEGRISRTGCLMKIFGGIGFLISKTQARVVFAHLHGAHRLKVALNTGWKLWFPRISLHLTGVCSSPDTKGLPPRSVRIQIAEWVRERMIGLQFQTEMQEGADTIPEEIERTARLQPQFRVIEDTSRNPISYTELFVRSNQLAEAIRFTAIDQHQVTGVIHPSGVGLPVILLSLWAAGKTPAILNPSAGVHALRSAISLARIRTVLTCRVYLQNLPRFAEMLADEKIRVVFTQDLQVLEAKHGWGMWLKNRFLPRLKKRAFEGRKHTAAVILFTSGSEGAPKAVQLSHANILANIRQMAAVSDLNNADRILNALPLFHSLGLTVGTLFGLARGCFVFLHPNPLQSHVIAETAYDQNATVLLSTNTFLALYAKHAHPYDFRSLRLLIAAGEKVHSDTFKIWSEKFGVRILEGYGATECGPALSANVPLACRVGSAGRFLPGIEWKVLPVTGIADGGRLFVRGPNVMRGYLNADPLIKTQSGWYDTGDVVRVDAEGFVHVTGRLKRFAKIGAEMISLCAVENALTGGFRDCGIKEFSIALVAVARPGQGETLVAVTTNPTLERAQLRATLSARGFSGLCVPAEVRFIARMPLLGTGKIDHTHLLKLLTENRLPLTPTAPSPIL
jgi:acyl-[acyl-carrier-protein]-phospholipid O-acyltransferase/long-chain-fatty-acid--[acyl-carrier-protein] ligase